MATVLVSGGAGFIGSWLCEELLKCNHEVICIDNLCTGREQNITHLKKSKSFHFIKEDVTKVSQSEYPGTDFIFHLASPASPKDYQRLELETLYVNSLGTLNMLKCAKENKARFLFASTSEVYGNPLEHPQGETYWGNVNPIGVRSMYDESKRFGETLCMAFFRQFGTDVRIARIFNTYGPRMKQNDGRVVSNFINQALENKPITIYGSGKQTRSFCYISDMIKGLMRLMFASNSDGEVVNMGNPCEKSILEIAKIIKKLTNSKSIISFKELPLDDPERRCPDISKAKKLLAWQPSVTLEEGLKKTAEWYKKGV